MEVAVTRRPAAGFSLLEVLVASAILLVVAIGILPLFVSSIRSNQQGNDSTKVANFARERLEEFFEYPFNSTTLTIDTGNARSYDEFYSSADGIWKPGVPPTDDPELWSRRTTVRQYSAQALEDGILEAAEILPASASASQIHLKEIEVTVTSSRQAGMLGPGKRLTLRTLKAQ